MSTSDDELLPPRSRYNNWNRESRNNGRGYRKQVTDELPKRTRIGDGLSDADNFRSVDNKKENSLLTSEEGEEKDPKRTGFTSLSRKKRKLISLKDDGNRFSVNGSTNWMFELMDLSVAKELAEQMVEKTSVVYYAIYKCTDEYKGFFGYDCNYVVFFVFKNQVFIEIADRKGYSISVLFSDYSTWQLHEGKIRGLEFVEEEGTIPVEPQKGKIDYDSQDLKMSLKPVHSHFLTDGYTPIILKNGVVIRFYMMKDYNRLKTVKQRRDQDLTKVLAEDEKTIEKKAEMIETQEQASFVENERQTRTIDTSQTNFGTPNPSGTFIPGPVPPNYFAYPPPPFYGYQVPYGPQPPQPPFVQQPFIHPRFNQSQYDQSQFGWNQSGFDQFNNEDTNNPY